MKLSRADITNFRSIESESIEWPYSCRILVGINESGKSNILAAIAMLSGEFNPGADDIREPLHAEEPVTSSFIRFRFALEPKDIGSLHEAVLKKSLVNSLDEPLCLNGKSKISLRDFISKHKEFLYRVNVIKENKHGQHWTMPVQYKKYKILDGWSKPTPSCPATCQVETNDGQTVVLQSFKLVNTNAVQTEIPDGYLEPVKIEEVWDFAGSELIVCGSDAMPECVYWKYDDKFMLPGKIPMTAFASNPDSCIPLKHMFELAGHENISKAITDAQGRKSGLKRLLDRVYSKTNAHIHKAWPEYKSVKILLAENGDSIDALVQDKDNAFFFSQRSDGFKRFVTFLLMISVKAHTGSLKDTVIIIDEPDIGLHPSGAQHLRDELIKISENNLVIFSTHSIFMIDRDQISRHLIVSKSVEKTTTSEVSSSNILDEEVIYKALGYSIFESLQKKNIIFEGWFDKTLFRMAIGTSSRLSKSAHNILKNVGTCHANGVSDVARVSPIMDLANRSCVIVSDSDKPAKNYKSDHENKNGYGEWFTYQDVLPSSIAVTGEDFLKPEYVKSCADTIAAENGLSSVVELSDLNDSAGMISCVTRWLKSTTLDSDAQKAFIKSLKKHIFSNLKKKHIVDEYFQWLSGLANKLDALD